MTSRRMVPVLGALALVLACSKTPSGPDGTDDPATLSITSTTLSSGTKGQAYSATLAVAGGEGGYTWAVSSGSLPHGLALSAAGEIGGTPTTVESASFTARVASGDGQSATKALTLDVHDDAAASLVVTESLGTTTVTEAGGTDDFTVALGAQPIGSVVVLVSAGDAGEATVSPASLTFTNGDWSTTQSVTVTGVDDDDVDGDQATTITVSVDDANSDDYFDAVADATVSVTTTDDDGVVRPVVRWTSAVSGVWSDASKWTPNGVPGPTDSVAIDVGGGYVVSLDQDATVAWLSLGAGAGGQTLAQATDVTLTVDSAALILSSGRYDLLMGTLAGGVVRNLGTVRAGTSADTSFITAEFQNDGLVQVLEGTLEIAGESTHDGDFEIEPGALLRFNEVGTTAVEGSVTGQGVLELDSSNDSDWLVVNGDTDVGGVRSLRGKIRFEGTFDVADSIRLNVGDVWTSIPATKQVRYLFMETQYAAWTGRTTLEVTDSLDIDDGTLAAQGPLRTLPGVPAVLFSVGFLGDLQLQGPSIWTIGQMSMSGSAQWEVLPGASLEIQGSTSLQQAQAGTSQLRIHPGATLTKSTATSSRFERPLLVEGDFHFDAGYFTFEHDFTLASGATLNGNGYINTMQAGTVTLDGTVSPGDSLGALTVAGDWAMGATGTTLFQLGGTTDSIGYDRLSVSDTVRLAGDLVIDTIAGFTPSAGEEFAVMTFEGRTGSFGGVSFPTITGVAFDTVWAEAGTVDTLFIVASPGPLEQQDFAALASGAKKAIRRGERGR